MPALAHIGLGLASKKIAPGISVGYMWEYGLLAGGLLIYIITAFKINMWEIKGQPGNNLVLTTL